MVIFFDLALMDDADFERGSAHIRRQDVFFPDQSAKVLAAHHAGRGAGLDRAYGVGAGSANVQNPAVCLHDQQFVSKIFFT